MTTICRLRHLLERHGLGAKVFQQVHRHLERQGIRVSTGTIVDATLISALSSTRNQKKERDPPSCTRPARASSRTSG